jgi:hypothetical protein
MRCILCGGDHEPEPKLCEQNPEGMDREINRLGSMRWARMSGLAMQKRMPPEMREWLRSLRAARLTASERGE